MEVNCNSFQPGVAYTGAHFFCALTSLYYHGNKTIS
jgi:hypothetical protein